MEGAIVQGESNKLADFLVETVSMFFQKTGEPILMSELGKLVRENPDKRLALPYGAKLLGFIRSHLLDSLSVVVHPQHSARIFIAPMGNKVEAEKFMQEHPPGIQTRPANINVTLPFYASRIQRAVLFAFQKPLGEGKRRYLSLHHPFRFGDDRESDPEKNKNEFIYIDRRFTMTQQEFDEHPFINPNEDPIAIAKFQEWLAETGLSPMALR
ncbi:MAG: hypothetical protein HQL63_14080 [Magnetococcales bacterium]|nr:hypothetical protein [Magnetococcales bacterium]MBF0322411.1 hypothetical protein [Magnetococcales bacterium]